MALIYHLLRKDEWEAALEADQYAPASLEQEGFIHFSTREQLLPSATRFFPNDQELIVLEIPEKRLKPHLRYDPTPEGQEFPHYYAPLDLDKVEEVSVLMRDKAGAWGWGR